MISPKRSTASIKVDRFEKGGRRRKSDVVTVEEPLEIRLEYGRVEARESRPVTVTMRTPGHDFELAAGFLFTEGLVKRRNDVARITYCQSEAPQEYNVVSVQLEAGVPFDPAGLNRNFYVTSSCGVCGKASLDAVEVQGCRELSEGSVTLTHDIISRLPDALRDAQADFERTGGIHASGLFTPEGKLLIVREDVGRHNALDKVVGHAFLEEDVEPSESVLVLSGRTSFELIQKALMARIPAVVAVGAPSSLAVDLARHFNMTLIGFARGTSYNVYTGSQRVAGSEG